MSGARPIRFHEVLGLADLGASGAGLLVKLEAERPGRSWFALLPSGTHHPADLRALDLKDAEPMRPDCSGCFGTAMSLPCDTIVSTCRRCGGWHWGGIGPKYYSRAQEESLRQRGLLWGQPEWLRRRRQHIRRLQAEEG